MSDRSHMTHSMTDVRIIHCETCGGDGGWDVPISHDPFTDTIRYSWQICEACQGHGEYEIEVEPVEMEDLE